MQLFNLTCCILKTNVIKNILCICVNGFLLLRSYEKELFCTREFVCRDVRYCKVVWFLFCTSCYRWHLGLLSCVYRCVWINLSMCVYRQAAFAVLVSLHILSDCTELFRKDQGSYTSLTDKLVSWTSHWGFPAMLLDPGR